MKTDEIPREVYVATMDFRRLLKRTKSLTAQQRSTLYGQALHGDLKGAMKGLDRLVGRSEENEDGSGV